jgi:death-on-curing protein
MSVQHVSIKTVVLLHDAALRCHGGLAGVRDWDSLRSALARAEHVEAYNTECDIFDIAAAVGCGIIHNHPFVDGNKRTGLLVMVEILWINGKLLPSSRMPEESAFQIILSIACGEKTAEELAVWLREITMGTKI